MFCANDYSVQAAAFFRPLIVRLSASGALLWANLYDIGTPAVNTLIREFMEDPATGNLYFIGREAGVGGVLFGVVSSAGVLLRAVAISNGASAEGVALSLTANGNFLIGGGTTLPAQGNRDLLFLELTATGAVVRAFAMGVAQDDLIRVMRRTGDVFTAIGFSRHSDDRRLDAVLATFGYD